MKLVVVTAPDDFSEEHRLIDDMFDLGLDTLHIRKPAWSAQKIHNWVSSFAPIRRAKMVIHQQYSIAYELDLKGIHVTSGDTPQLASMLSRVKRERPRLTVSTSCHTIEEILDLDERLDYAFLSPVSASISKPGYGIPYIGSQFTKLATDFRDLHIGKKCDVPIIALGGVSKDGISDLQKMGFRGVAFLGDVWSAKSPVTHVKSIISKINEFTSFGGMMPAGRKPFGSLLKNFENEKCK